MLLRSRLVASPGVRGTILYGRRIFSTGRPFFNEDHYHGHSHGHSHDAKSLLSHSHSHSSADSVLRQSGGLRNPAIRITWLGLFVNVGMAVGKGVGGVVFHSQALLADSIHAVSDLVSDFLTLATITVGTKPVSEKFPYGYGKVETLGSLGVSTLLVLAGVSMGWSGLETIVHQVYGDLSLFDMIPLGHGHSHSHGGGSGEIADLNAAWLALGSIFIKEYLYQATMKVAKKTNSTVLVANAWHHRIDSLVSMVAVATIGAGYIYGIQWLDPLGGLIVSSIIVRAGYGTAKTACLELADSNARGDERIEEVQEKVAGALTKEECQFEIANLEVMPSGPNYTVIVQLKPIDSSATLDDFKRAQIVLKSLFHDDGGMKKLTVTLI
ncbi:mitochondrial metal transporter 2 [Trichomonascus vanleenenianus]|uniref:cation diffusion facilitator family transporter n=1 Tax=Trichomonascus vanleenenianus TaxID=2268995 RepID=UPI003EC9F6D3